MVLHRLRIWHPGLFSVQSFVSMLHKVVAQTSCSARSHCCLSSDYLLLKDFFFDMRQIRKCQFVPNFFLHYFRFPYPLPSNQQNDRFSLELEVKELKQNCEHSPKIANKLSKIASKQIMNKLNYEQTGFSDKNRGNRAASCFQQDICMQQLERSKE